MQEEIPESTSRICQEAVDVFFNFDAELLTASNRHTPIYVALHTGLAIVRILANIAISLDQIATRLESIDNSLDAIDTSILSK